MLGLAISTNLLAQSNGYSQAIENTNSAIASTQIASSAAINEQSKILDNVKEKLLQASNRYYKSRRKRCYFKRYSNST